MLLFDSILSLKEYLYHGMIFAANQYIIGHGVAPNDIFWSFLSIVPNQNITYLEALTSDNVIAMGDGCVIADRNDEDNPWFTIIKDRSRGFVRIVCERIVTRNGPVIMDIKINYDPKTTDYNFGIGFAVAPAEDECALHEECQLAFATFLGMGQQIESESYVKMKQRELDGVEESDE